MAAQVWQPTSITWASTGSVERNKGPIAAAFTEFVASRQKPTRSVLEVASGFGDHVQLLASSCKEVQFQPTEAQSECLDRLSEIQAANVRQPLRLNVLDEGDWARLREKGTAYDCVLSINMIHISPAASTEALFRGASTVLGDEGCIMLYGAYLREDGTFASEGDRAFDADLRSRDSGFGLRNVRDVDTVASKFNFVRVHTREMPSNNKIYIWQRQATL